MFTGATSSSPAIVEAWCQSRTMFPTGDSVFYTTGTVAHVTLTTSVAGGMGFKLFYVQNATGNQLTL